MKRIILVLLTICMLLTQFSTTVEASQNYSSREDFDWGVTGHRSGLGIGYPRNKLEDQIHAAAELGVKLYRVNIDPVQGYEYIDEVVSLCNAYGMKVMAVVTQMDHEASEELTEMQWKALANRYNGQTGHGKIDYYQLMNERDLPMLEAKHGRGNEPDGSLERHYNESDLKAYYDFYKIAARVIREYNPDAKIVINMGYLHYGMFFYFTRHNLDFDMIGVDWYENMGNFERVLEPLIQYFPDKDIIICETNVWDKEVAYDSTKIDEWKWLLDSMEQVYKYDQVKGMIFYELLDEPGLDNGGIEENFGLMYNTSNGDILGPKAIYTEIQRLLGGSTLEKIMLKDLVAEEETEVESETEPMPSETETQPSGNGNVDNPGGNSTKGSFPIEALLVVTLILVLICVGIIVVYGRNLKKKDE